MRARASRTDGAWAAACLFVALTFLLTYPLSITANRTLPSDDPDGHLFMWTLAWDAHAFIHQPLSIFDANIFYPNHNSLAYSENLIGSAVFAAPVLWLTGNPVLAVNVVSLLSCMLCGLGAYVLGRRVGLSAAGAVLTGLIFAFSPPRFFRFSQLHLAAVQWIPFALASLHAYFEGGQKRDLRLAIAFFTLQVLASGHGGVFAGVAILLMLTYRFGLGERIMFRQRLRDIGVAGAVMLIPVVVIAIPYRISQVEVGLRRVLDTSGTPLQDFVASPTRVDGFLQSLFTNQNINADATAWLFPGFLPLLLVLAAIAGGSLTVADRVKRHAPSWSTAKLPLVVCLSALVLSACLAIARPLLHAGDGLTVQSYPDGKLVWTGFLAAGEPGSYAFGTTSDADARLSIDNFTIIDYRGDRSGASRTGSAVLAAGSHRILLEHAPTADRPGLDLVWARDGGSADLGIIPSWALSRRQAAASAVRTIRALEWLRLVSVIAAGAAALAALYGWLADYRQSPTGFYLLLTIVSIGLAVGAERYGLWQFVYWLPGFNFIRGASRFMVLGLLGVAVLAGVGFDWLTSHIASHRRLTGIVVGGLLIAEFWVVPYKGVPYRLEIPAADQWVAQQPKPFSIAEVPVTTSARYHSNYMLHSMAHWQKTVHGFSGIRPALHQELYDQLRSFPSDESINHLAQLDVTYVIVHSSWFLPEERRLLEERLPAFDSWLTLEYMDADSRVYSIHHPKKQES